MVINGLTDKRRLPRIGKVRIGEKAISASGNEYPKAIDHFLFDAEDEQLTKTAQELCGEKPKVLDITFPFDDVEPFDNVFPQYWKCYRSSRGCVCKGDGIKATETLEDGTLNDEKICPCEKSENGKCRKVASLKFAIKGFPALGIWQIDTGGVNNIININSALALTRQMAGRISGIPFRLSLEPQDFKVDGKKKGGYVLHLRAVGTLSKDENALPAATESAIKQLEGAKEPEITIEEVSCNHELDDGPQNKERAEMATDQFKAKTGCISSLEAKMIFTTAKKFGITDAEVLQAMKVNFDKVKTADLTADDFAILIDWIGDYAKIKAQEKKQ